MINSQEPDQSNSSSNPSNLVSIQSKQDIFACLENEKKPSPSSSLPFSSDPELKWLEILKRFFLQPEQHVPKDLVTSSLIVVGSFLNKRTFILTESENQYLFDKQGNIKKNAYLTGRLRVTCFPPSNPEFYLKQFPEWPGYEFASTLFMRELGIKNLPYQDLLIIKNYPVLLSQKVDGAPVLRLWENPKVFNHLDRFHTALLIISAMLINPEDGKEDNFILSPDGKYLIPIDNDHCFLPSTLQKEGSVWNVFAANTALQTKTILFCLDQMYMPIPLELRQHIISLDFDSLLTKWMAELDKIENRFKDLVDRGQHNHFLQQGTIMRIPLSKQFIENLHWKAHRIRDILKSASGATPFDLLKAVEPFVARCYEDSFKQGRDLQNRFIAATKNLYKKTAGDGSRISLLNTHTMMEIINISGNNLSPAGALELLNKLIEEHRQKSIIENDMMCELDDASHHQKWTNLLGSPLAEAALKAFFTNPKEVLTLKGSKLITSNKLTELFACKGMGIRFLSLPQSPLLAEKEIRILAEECPNIEYLNVSGCLKLKQLITREGEWALLSRLEAKGCLNLEKLVSNSPLKILQIQTNQKGEVFVGKSTIEFFSIKSESNQFEFSFKKAQDFQIRFGSFTSSSNDFGKVILNEENWNLIKYRLQEFRITIGPLTFSSGEDLAIFVRELNCSNLENIKIENLQRIIKLNLISLKKLDLSSSKIQDEGLEILTRGENWPSLEMLHLRDTKITAKGIRSFGNQANWPQLKILDLNSNEIYDEGIEILVQKNLPLLESLSISKTKITNLGAETLVNRSNWPLLKNLDLSGAEIDDEGLEILAQGNWPLLELLGLLKIDITKRRLFKFLLQGPKWPKLKVIYVEPDASGDNLLQFQWSLFPKKWAELEQLDLSKNGITRNEIELLVKKANWPNLEHLNLSGNEYINDEGLEILARGDWPELKTLNLEKTKMTNLGVEALVKNSNWPQLKSLNLSDNEINDEGLEVLAHGAWPKLRSLDLTGADMTKKGLLKLFLNANWPNLDDLTLPEKDSFGQDMLFSGCQNLMPINWARLQILDLSKSGITQNEIELMVKKANWPNLQFLDLSDNEINDEGLVILAQGNWPSLEILSLNNTGVMKKSLSKLVPNRNWLHLQRIHIKWDVVETCFLQNLRFSPQTFSLRNWSELTYLDLSFVEILQNELEIIVRCELPQLKYLDISSKGLDDESIEILAQGNWPLLETLDLKDTKITAVGIEIIVKKSSWPRLRSLDFSGTEIKDEGIEILAQGNWPELTSLVLPKKGITKKGLFQLLFNANWPNLSNFDIYSELSEENEEMNLRFYAKDLLQKNWAQLKVLKLDNSGITNSIIEEIIKKVSNWSQLECLDLSGNEIDDEGLEILTQGNWPLLETLDLTNTKVSPKGLLKLVLNANPWPNLNHIKFNDEDSSWYFIGNLLPVNWSRIEFLDLGKSEITQNDIEKIFQYQLTKLRYLNLSSRELLDDEDVKILAQGNWPELETLDLKDTKITTVGIEIIVKKSNWPQLKNLYLPGNELKDEGVEMLAQGNWPLLESLDLTNTEVSLENIETLIEKSSWPKLNEIYLQDEARDDEEIDAIQKSISARWPNIKIITKNDDKSLCASQVSETLDQVNEKKDDVLSISSKGEIQ